MDPLILGLMVAVATIVVLFSGISVAIGLLLVAAGFLLAFDGMRSVALMPEIFFGGLDNFALLSIPMFIIMGASIASTRAGADLYEALDRWLTRVPGGLVISNLGACALFAAMSGSSPATCAAIGKMGIPEMRKRGYPDGVAAGSIAAGGTLGIVRSSIRLCDFVPEKGDGSEMEEQAIPRLVRWSSNRASRSPRAALWSSQVILSGS